MHTHTHTYTVHFKKSNIHATAFKRISNSFTWGTEYSETVRPVLGKTTTPKPTPTTTKKLWCKKENKFWYFDVDGKIVHTELFQLHSAMLNFSLPMHGLYTATMLADEAFVATVCYLFTGNIHQGKNIWHSQPPACGPVFCSVVDWPHKKTVY